MPLRDPFARHFERVGTSGASPHTAVSAVQVAGPRRRILILGVVALAVLGVLAYWLLSRTDDRLADPGSVELPPPPADVTSSVAFFSAEGAPVLAVHRIATELSTGDVATSNECRELSLHELPSIGEPPALVALAERVPDAVASELSRSELVAMSDFLRRCIGSEEPDREELQFAVRVLERRLVELGVPQ